ncbi:CotH kinase family protein [Exiguobacterium algae]|uniref:CotH kinase family protein n=1 Tax=Exiguobacterium algae TaxID=2751250 RepID=UPI001BE83D68|nr:CotH kinase family protein [Exiguobacterium algae]
MKRLPYPKTMIGILVLFLILLALQAALKSSSTPTVVSSEKKTDTETAVLDPTFKEDKRVYDRHDGNKLEHVYVTVFDQASVPENDLTLFDLNESYKQYSNLESGPKLFIHFETGDAEGPDGIHWLDDQTVNATIQLRGRSSRLEPQKSYKIRLQDSAGLWYGQSVLNLNKHADDRTRVRNRLAFSYYEMLDDISSLRTNFVQLHVRDMTNPAVADEFVDYGLFTHVEQLNEDGLAARGLNPDGHLYKAENFEFHRYPDALKLKSDPDYDKKTFESVLKINGSDNHEELLTMLDDLNDLSQPFDKVFDKYFDEDNYLTWLGTNILFGNYDTMSTNYYLYSPLNSEKWYFMPWDFDKALGRDTERTDPMPSWQRGIQRYWGTVLHRRYLKDPKNVAALQAKVEELTETINPETTKQLIDGFYPVVEPVVTSEPDLRFLDIEATAYEPSFRKLETITTMYEEEFLLSLEKPMPIFLQYAREKEKDVFRWDASYDLQNDELTYHFELSRTPDFTSLIAEQNDMTTFAYEMSALDPGRYYWRVTVTDAEGNEQIPFDYYRDNDRKLHWGIQQIVIPGEAS